MAKIETPNEKTLQISVELEDATRMVAEAARDIPGYARDIVTIYEKMPAFDYTSFCFYAYDTARLFEWLLEMDPRNYNSFSLKAPDSFFYTLYGGMAALYARAKEALELQQSASV